MARLSDTGSVRIDIRQGNSGTNADGLTFSTLMNGMLQMPKGTIKKLVTDKGFGFISGDNGDLFFHVSALQDCEFESLEIGQAVDYEEGEGPKGPRATEVRPA